ncbi:twitching motility protein PilT [Jatrophihabitans sp. GAS493]|uniref:type IV pilus twitching motility protein PilT n=1 Tax=Jatrophihabitans sp. GAS493 TaxID=1907575 RepID=UPI000BBF62E6|nr:type IV pilus twitching motility protein PilT [Jatrophihabitans sp. GAS493]SOD74767.1 twitching motility protein PilT [Jatrophihabitans sp. GAS493]
MTSHTVGDVSQRSHGSVDLSEERAALDTMLTELVQAKGSDLHLGAGVAPKLRVSGDLYDMHGYPELTATDIAMLIRSIVTDGQWERFERTQELDLAHDVPGISRFRVNVFCERGGYGAVFRAIPHEIRSLAELEMPSVLGDFGNLHRGLVLVTGPTGSGKTTTLAALLDEINRRRSGHILTIEDPIEFVHHGRKSKITQREVGSDTASFAIALKAALRQDPDVILVGEMRDIETAAVAITAAETGHLVLATLHTSSAAQTIDRLIDMFPHEQQNTIRAQLANTLQGIVTQALVRRIDRPGRVAVTEVLVATSAIRNLVREGKIHQIPSFMQSSSLNGMHTFDSSLASQVRAGAIDERTARGLAHSPEDFDRLFGRR